jgi:hypothetical protein
LSRSPHFPLFNSVLIHSPSPADDNSPASPRDFVFAILTVETTPPPSATTDSGTGAPLRSFVVVSIPVDAPQEKGHVRGKYVSVEHCQETEEGGVLWTCVLFVLLFFSVLVDSIDRCFLDIAACSLHRTPVDGCRR